MTVRIPELPTLSSRVPTEIRNALIKLHQALKSADLSGGLATGDDISSLSTSISEETAEAIAGVVTGPSAAPAAPVDLTATGAFNQILLKVNSPNADDQVQYTEFLRATVDDPNEAELVARISGTSYPDTPPDSRLSVKYYYWAQFVNVIGTGPLNATAGTVASTADEPGYILDALVADKWQEETDYVVDNVVTPVNVDGKALQCTVAGTSGTAEPTWPTVIGNTVVDGGVTWELMATDVTLEKIFKIALVSGNWVAAIKAAFIQDLTSENFVAKKIVADEISTALAESYQQIVGWLLRSSDGLVQLDMLNKFLKMENSAGDYCLLSEAELEFYEYGDIYKAVRRIEQGTQTGGSPVVFSPAFKTTPKVLMSIREMPTFDNSYATSDFVINMAPESLTPNGFIPTAELSIPTGVDETNEFSQSFLNSSTDRETENTDLYSVTLTLDECYYVTSVYSEVSDGVWKWVNNFYAVNVTIEYRIGTGSWVHVFTGDIFTIAQNGTDSPYIRTISGFSSDSDTVTVRITDNTSPSGSSRRSSQTYSQVSPREYFTKLREQGSSALTINGEIDWIAIEG